MSDLRFELEPLSLSTSLEKEWESLRSQENQSFFLSWMWIGTWLKCLPLDVGLKLLRISNHQKTVGLAILKFKRSRLRKVIPVRQGFLHSLGEREFDNISIEHNGIASSESVSKLVPALVVWFESYQECEELILPGVIFDSGLTQSKKLLVTDYSQPGYRVPLKTVAAAGGVGSLLTRTSRQQLRRAIRNSSIFGELRMDRARDRIEALGFFREMKRLHINSWQRRERSHAFVEPFFEKFHLSIIDAYYHTGKLDLLRVRAGDQVLGYLYNFVDAGTIYNYQSGFDYGVSKMRPGYLSHAQAIEYYSALDMQYYDFLAGHNPLKKTFGLERYEMHWFHLCKPTLGFKIEFEFSKFVFKLKRRWDL